MSIMEAQQQATSQIFRLQLDAIPVEIYGVQGVTDSEKASSRINAGSLISGPRRV